MNKVEILLNEFIVFYEGEVYPIDYGHKAAYSPHQIFDYQCDIGLIYMNISGYYESDIKYKGELSLKLYNERLIEMSEIMDELAIEYYGSEISLNPEHMDDYTFYHYNIMDIKAQIQYLIDGSLIISARAAGAICFIECKLDRRDYPTLKYGAKRKYFREFAESIEIEYGDQISTGFTQWKRASNPEYPNGKFGSIKTVKNYFSDDNEALALIDKLTNNS